jgi:selenocysteine lyase/cysteine desulfurase
VITCGAKAGFTVLGAVEGKGLSGIVSLMAEGRDVAKLHAELEAAQVVTSLRYCRDGRQCLRLSPHFYNREEEIVKLFAQI